ncbi:hypothetical protein NDU88_005312 [Pleurodeles waltl]|uniref:Uncharacterized protein n=1 Tax=Pleurodeles waltl TaxID=8319 RepID=A0AAV7TAM1_PLEWA|nr:hypothetical protein NDU88_005312 [Pleurodeles waltl]
MRLFPPGNTAEWQQRRGPGDGTLVDTANRDQDPVCRLVQKVGPGREGTREANGSIGGRREQCREPRGVAKRRRPRPTRHQPTYRRDPLTMDEALNERRQAMEAAARIGGATGRSGITPPRSPQKEDEHSDSDSETATSTQSSILLPVITPGTADEII